MNLIDIEINTDKNTLNTIFIDKCLYLYSRWLTFPKIGKVGQSGENLFVVIILVQ
jgi:hypothetical protein